MLSRLVFKQISFEYEHEYGGETSITIEFIGNQFLTCYRDEFLTFKFYITPFKPWLWFMIAISLLSIIVITSAFKYFGGFKTISFTPWLFILATIFEEDGYIPVKIDREPFYRLIFRPWCLMAVFLTNCYTGMMISELNSPLQAIRPGTFDDLACNRMGIEDVHKFVLSFEYYRARTFDNVLPSPRDDRSMYGYDRAAWYWVYTRSIQMIVAINLRSKRPIPDLINPFASKECFQLLSLPSGYASGHPAFLQFILNLHSFVIQANMSEQILKVLNLLDPRHSYFPIGKKYLPQNTTMLEFRNTIKSDLVKCGRTVFIANSDILEAEFQFVEKHYTIKKFYKGKEIMLEVPFRWSFYREGSSKVPRYIKGLVESGIYKRLKEEDIRKKYLKRKPIKKVRAEELFKPVKLYGAILTLFVLCGSTLLAASLGLVVECRYFIYALVQNVVTVVGYMLLKIKFKYCYKNITDTEID